MTARYNLIGKVFGKLTVLSDAGNCPKAKQSLWLCICECGNEKQVMGSQLTSGHTRSCGCLRAINVREIQKKRWVKNEKSSSRRDH